MTEAEAATKMCCGPLGGLNFTQSGTNDNHRDLTTCIGRECMAWRWTSGPTGDKPGEGYCGLAGK